MTIDELLQLFKLSPDMITVTGKVMKLREALELLIATAKSDHNIDVDELIGKADRSNESVVTIKLRSNVPINADGEDYLKGAFDGIAAAVKEDPSFIEDAQKAGVDPYVVIEVDVMRGGGLN